MTKRIEIPSDDPLPPGAKVLSDTDIDIDSATVGDVTGIRSKSAYAETTKLISQFGLLAVFSAFILTVCGTVLWLGRIDLLNSVRDTNTMHLLMFKELREDAKEDRFDNKSHQQRMWQQLRDLTNATQEGNKTLIKSANMMEENHQIFVRILAEQKRANATKESKDTP